MVTQAERKWCGMGREGKAGEWEWWRENVDHVDSGNVQGP